MDVFSRKVTCLAQQDKVAGVFLCKDSGNHISPQWYDIVHFGPKPSWICFWTYPKRPHTNGDICPSLYIHDPSHF